MALIANAGQAVSPATHVTIGRPNAARVTALAQWFGRLLLSV
jgi:hypothetical protein